ncbi:hypothetical protein Xcaj_18510 [Xanthomonas axonopodis pv. cajani]|uniref:Uncharacterized protein n=2 Tax=Xanthomonas axonopodis TaxID=53413 RepID=A0ABX3M649_9XANT|nr:hypothetical protein Xcaj_18510 [Xanthomonas axonopodis pv. cajani]
MLEEQLKLIQVELIENGKLTGFAAIGNRDSLEKRQVRLRGEFSEFLRRLTKMRENFTECVEDRCRLVTKLAYQSIVTMRAEVEASTDVNLLIAGAGQAGERVEAETASSSARRRRVFGKKWIAKTLDTEGRIRKIRQVVRKAFAAMQGLFSF